LVRSRRRRENRIVAGDDGEEVARMPAGEPGPDRLLASGEVQQRVERALRRMSELERTAFVLRHHEGLSLREIGETLAVNESAAKQSLFRAVRKLREALGRAGMVA
jgi:RNA polymerase sigma-70 factor (ECF subfamily)